MCGVRGGRAHQEGRMSVRAAFTARSGLWEQHTPWWAQ